MTRRYRREFPSRVKAAAFLRCAGVCEFCGVKLMSGRIEYDHILADWLGGEPTVDNCCVLCRACHARKTGGYDAPAIAKVKRIRVRHAGALDQSRNPMPCGRKSRWKRKISGEIVKRT